MTTFGNTRDAMAAAKTRMEKAVDDFRKEIGTLRTGRANAAILDNVRVDYHGTPMRHPDIGPGAEPDERRQDRARADARAHRRAPQGNREASP